MSSILDCHNCDSENITKRSASMFDIADCEVLVCDDCKHVHIARCSNCEEFFGKEDLKALICRSCGEFIL